MPLYSVDVLNTLIELGADVQQKGWLTHRGHCYFGNSVEIAIYLKEVARSNVGERMLTILTKTFERIVNRMDPNGKVSSINDVTQFWTIFDPPPSPIVTRFITTAFVL